METEFNWYDELDKLIEQDPSEDTYLDLKKRAYSWVTCGCGQVCKALPRDSDGMPLDWQLSTLGFDFSESIADSNWTEALGILNQIEARTSQLLKELRS